MSYHLTRTAVFVILERDNHIFMLRRKDTGWNDGRLTLPSGHVDKGEGVRSAATREVKEEAGVTVKEGDLTFVHAHYCFDTYTNYYFRANVWEGEPILNEPHLASEAVWVSKNNIPKDTIFHVRHMFAEIEKNNYFSDVENDPGNINL